MKKVIIIGLGVMGMLITGYAEKTDILKPVYQRQEQELRRIMERLASEGLEYEIIEREIKSHSVRNPDATIKTKVVQVPKDLEEKITKYSPRFVLRNFTLYLDDPKYSFYAGVLIFAYIEPVGEGILDPVGIIAHDKEKWFRELPQTKIFFARFLRNMRQGQEMGPLTMFPGSFYGAILFESISPYYNTHVFASRVYRRDPMSADEENPVQPTGGEYTKSFDAFLKDGDKDALKEIALVQPCVEYWLYLTLFGEEEKQLLSLDGLLAWSRIKSPIENPFLSALAMGLFTVNGYSFNDETGVYTMNERGRMLMDFIVEFPIPENATRLKAVIDGGNKDEIQAMMKKHNTEEKWKALLQNPVHPEFAKYPQD